MKSRIKKIILLLSIIGIALCLIYFTPLRHYISYEKFHGNKDYFLTMVEQNYLFSVLVFICTYAFLISCAIPATAPFTLIGGFLFGLFPGFLYSLIACGIGATISFLVFRYVIHRWIHGWHNARVDHFNARFKAYGASYLLMLHFLSVIPYFVVNLLAASADVPLRTYVWTLLVGSTPLLFLYSFAAQQLTTIHSIRDIFSPPILIMIGILIVIAFIPVFIKKVKGPFGV